MPRVSERLVRMMAGTLSDLLFRLAHFTETSWFAADVTDDTLPAFYFEVKTTLSAALFIDSKHFIFSIPKWARFVALVKILGHGGDESRVCRCAELLSGQCRLWRRGGRRQLAGGDLRLCTHPLWTKVHSCSGHFARL